MVVVVLVSVLLLVLVLVAVLLVLLPVGHALLLVLPQISSSADPSVHHPEDKSKGLRSYWYVFLAFSP